MSTRDRSRANTREAIRRAVRDLSIEHNVLSERDKERTLAGIQWGMVVQAADGDWRWRAHDLGSSTTYDSGGRYSLFRHKVRLFSPAAPHNLANFFRQTTNSGVLPYPNIPSDLSSNTDLQVSALAIGNIYPEYTMVLVSRDVAGFWWILDFGMRIVHVQIGSGSMAYPHDVSWDRVRLQQGPGYFLPSAPDHTTASTALTLVSGNVALRENKHAVCHWTGHKREYYVMLREC